MEIPIGLFERSKALGTLHVEVYLELVNLCTLLLELELKDGEPQPPLGFISLPLEDSLGFYEHCTINNIKVS